MKEYEFLIERTSDWESHKNPSVRKFSSVEDLENFQKEIDVHFIVNFYKECYGHDCKFNKEKIHTHHWIEIYDDYRE